MPSPCICSFGSFMCLTSTLWPWFWSHVRPEGLCDAPLTCIRRKRGLFFPQGHSLPYFCTQGLLNLHVPKSCPKAASVNYSQKAEHNFPPRLAGYRIPRNKSGPSVFPFSTLNFLTTLIPLRGVKTFASAKVKNVRSYRQDFRRKRGLFFQQGHSLPYFCTQGLLNLYVPKSCPKAASVNYSQKAEHNFPPRLAGYRIPRNLGMGRVTRIAESYILIYQKARVPRMLGLLERYCKST